MQQQFRMLERLTVGIAVTGFLGLVGVVILTVIDVGLRYGGGQRLPGFDDYGQILFPIIVASCFPVGLLHNRNIAITFLGMGLGIRATRVLTLFAAVLTFAFFLAVAWRFVLMTIDLGRTGAVTATVLMPVTPTWWLATGLLWLTVPIQAWVVWVRMQELWQGRDLLPPPQFEQTE